MKLIVGLGNPGFEYAMTRHNVGFMVIDEFDKNFGQHIWKNKLSGLYQQIVIKGEKIILLKPQKFMNLSGEVVKDYANYFKIDIDNVLIISDDLDMPCGKIKIKIKGSCGGHNGLKNIEENLHTINYKRLKIGISNNQQIATKDYVLQKFDREQLIKINECVASSVHILEEYIDLPFDKLMSKYNIK